MTDDEAMEFMELFREYRNNGHLPPEKRKRFKELAAMVKRDKDSEGNEPA